MTLMTTFKNFKKKVTQKFVDRNGNVVPLPSQLSCNGDCGLRLSIARASSALHLPCTAIVTRKEEELQI